MSALIPASPRVFRPLSKVSWSPGKTPALSVAAVLLLFVTLWFIASGSSSEGKSLSLSVAPSKALAPELSAVSVSAAKRLGYVTVTGEARNLSQSSLTNVEAVVELLDRRGNITAVESALIGVRQLGASESTPLSIALRDPGESTSFKLRFRTLMGRSISATLSPGQ